MRVSDVTARLRQPEYTGANRCLPCTVVNVVLSGVLGLGLSAVFTPVLGLVAFLAAIALVYLRGYLVPGTPELTETYFPPWLLRLFGKEPIETVDTASTRTDADRESSADTTDEPLVAAGVVAPDHTALTDDFHDAWVDRAATVASEGVDADDVAAAFGAASARRTSDTSFVLDGSKSVHWGSAAAIAADVAGAALLDDRLDDWAASDRDRRQTLLLGLRLCLRACPACGGEVTLTQERVDPCCEKPHLVADATCDGCGAPLSDAAVVDDGTTDTVQARLLAG
jgi:hypothetical protein